MLKVEIQIKSELFFDDPSFVLQNDVFFGVSTS